MSDRNEFGAFAIGLVIGGLAGAVAALLFAPQSGEQTRAQIKEKSMELRDKAQQSSQEAMARADELASQLKEKGQSAVESVRSKGAKKPDSVPAEPAA
jgi:gas vesicle protein